MLFCGLSIISQRNAKEKCALLQVRPATYKYNIMPVASLMRARAADILGAGTSHCQHRLAHAAKGACGWVPRPDEYAAMNVRRCRSGGRAGLQIFHMTGSSKAQAPAAQTRARVQPRLTDTCVRCIFPLQRAHPHSERLRCSQHCTATKKALRAFIFGNTTSDGTAAISSLDCVPMQWHPPRVEHPTQKARRPLDRLRALNQKARRATVV